MWKVARVGCRRRSCSRCASRRGLAGALVDGQLSLDYGRLNSLRGHYARLRTLSMLRYFLGKEGLRDLDLPITPVWAIPPIIAVNLLESGLIGRTRLGRHYLEHAADRSSQRLLKLRFGTAPAKIGALPAPLLGDAMPADKGG